MGVCQWPERVSFTKRCAGVKRGRGHLNESWGRSERGHVARPAPKERSTSAVLGIGFAPSSHMSPTDS